MQTSTPPVQSETTSEANDLAAIIALLQDDTDENLNDAVASLSLHQLAHLLESVPEQPRLKVWRCLAPDQQWGVIAGLQNETTKNLIASLSDDEQLLLQTHASATDLISFAEVMPEEMVDAIILDQDEDTAEELQQALSYDDSQVGRFVERNILRVRSGIRVSAVIARLRKKEYVSAIFLVNSERSLLGSVPIAALFHNPEHQVIDDLAKPVTGIDHETELSDAVNTAQLDSDIAYLPVLKNGRVIGALAVATLLDELRDDFVISNLSEAPSSEEDLFTPISVAAKTRALWLCINLATAFLASWVIGLYENALREVVALAILMPVVASMGGIAGSQTLAVALRGIALNHITDANIRLLLRKETLIAILNGVLLGAVIAVIVGWWFDSPPLGGIIWAAIIINSLAAASSGTYIPFILEKMNIDPAISAAVILTTVTDVVGFMIFLGLGSLIFL